MADLGIEVETEDGDELFAHCPGHKARVGKADGHPSWSINAETGVHYCFSCHYRGNLITLIRDVKGTDAAARFRTEFEVHKRVLLADQDFEMAAIDKPLPLVTDIRTANFLPESKLDDFVDPPRWALKERRITVVGAKEYGVRWDPARDAWVLPLRDPHTDRLLGYQKKAQKTRWFRNHPRTMPKSETFFGWSVARDRRKVVVVESPLDAILLADMGASAIAICGSHLSEVQERLLMKGGFGRVYLWLDNDHAGLVENRRLGKVLLERGVVTEFITADSYPELNSGKDVGELSFAQIEAVLDQAGV